jgi:hypothetical protein
MCACAGVEHDGRPALVGLLLSTDHQLVGTCGRPPVDAPQLVTEAVLAHHDILGARRGEGAWSVLTCAGPVA